MARAFAAARGKEPWAAIFASPLKRTIATAQPISAATGLKPELRDDLKEIHYGKWEWKAPEAIDREFHDDYLRWSADPAWNAPTGGEPAIAIARRALQVVEEIKSRHAEGQVLVVSHKATIRILLCGLLGVDVGRFRYRFACPVGSVSHIEFTNEGPLLHSLADRTHLSTELRSLPGT